MENEEEEDDDEFGKKKEKEGQVIEKKGHPSRVSKLPIQSTLSVNRVALVQRGGKLMRFAAIVVVGNGKGLAGIGKGKDIELPRAVEKATARAHRLTNLHFFELYDGRTIFHNVEHYFKKTKVVAMTAREGVGHLCNHTISDMCEAIGIEDIRVKVHGSTNPHNMTKAFWEAMLLVKTPEMVARYRGKAMLDTASLRAGLGPGHSTIKPSAARPFANKF